MNQIALTPFYSDVLEFDPNKYEYNIAYFNMLEFTGKSTHYGHKFHGRKTSSGEIHYSNDYTAAHRTFRFGTIVKVTNLDNNLSVIVKINDRGPYTKGKIIDLSDIAAKSIDGLGVAKVKLQCIRQFNRDVRDSENRFMNGYSIYNDLISIPSDMIMMIDSSSNYSKTFKKYLKLNKISIKKNLYLFTPAYRNKSEWLENSEIYYLGYVKQGI